MTTEEAESLGSSAKQWLRHGSTGYCCDCVVRAWLADHPADDGETITEAWLRSAGAEDFADDDGVYAFGFRIHDRAVLSVCADNGSFSAVNRDEAECVVLCNSPEAVLKTRSQVRRLCDALNIKLRGCT